MRVIKNSTLQMRTHASMQYHSLPANLVDLVANGIGPRCLPIKAPQLIFRRAGRQHDLDYWAGGDRTAADATFKFNMDSAIRGFDGTRSVSALLKKLVVYPLVAKAYHYAVRRWGADFFNDGPVRTAADLARLANVEAHILRSRAFDLTEAAKQAATVRVLAAPG